MGCWLPGRKVETGAGGAATRSKHFIDTIKIIAHLCIELNAIETTYPGADLRMIFKSASF